MFLCQVGDGIGVGDAGGIVADSSGTGGVGVDTGDDGAIGMTSR